MFVAVTSAVLLISIFVRVSLADNVFQESGEITWIDTKLGKLELKNDTSPNKGEVTGYRISENETRVTDPKDKKFLTIEDLQPGQHVIIDIVIDEEEKIVQKITADPRPSSEYQESYGKIEAIDAVAGTFTLSGRQIESDMGGNNLSYFVFDPNNILVMQSPSDQPVRIILKSGDVVKVEYAVRDRKQQAYSITLYSPKYKSITTTTTTTTTRQQ